MLKSEFEKEIFLRCYGKNFTLVEIVLVFSFKDIGVCTHNKSRFLFNILILPSNFRSILPAHSTSVDGSTIEMKAEVALLTRRIKIEGNEYTNSESESFGTRVLVGQTFYKGEQRAGTLTA